MATTHETSTKQDILQYLLKQGQATAHELAESLDISPQAIRRHLKDLETEGLIQYQSVHAGMGRPQHLYELTREGRHRFPDQYDKFAISLLDTLTETVGQEQVSSILRKQWQRKAIIYRNNLGKGSLQERVAKLVELRRAEGYMAEWHSVEPAENTAQSDSGFIISEHHCAISHIAESFPNVCDHELEMFAMALEDCTVERTHRIIDGQHQCGYLIKSR